MSEEGGNEARTEIPDTSKPMSGASTTETNINQNESSKTGKDNKNEDKNKQCEEDMGDEKWKCPICLESLQQPVVTHCGHVFCWPCISEWLRRSSSCPVCHGALNANQLIPIYGQGSEANTSVPPPPRPEYHEATNRRFPAFNFTNGFTPYQYTFTTQDLREAIQFQPQVLIQVLAFMFLIFCVFI